MNKFQFLEKEVCANLNILLISKIKLDDPLPSKQFSFDEFPKPYILDWCLNGGGILLYIGLMFSHVYFWIQIKLKVYLLRLISEKGKG